MRPFHRFGVITRHVERRTKSMSSNGELSTTLVKLKDCWTSVRQDATARDSKHGHSDAGTDLRRADQVSQSMNK